MKHLTLYGRPGCHLCEDMRAALEEYRAGFNFILTEIDIDSDAALAERYGLLIPVLADADRAICQAFLNPAALRAFLDRPEGNG